MTRRLLTLAACTFAMLTGAGCAADAHDAAAPATSKPRTTASAMPSSAATPAPTGSPAPSVANKLRPAIEEFGDAFEARDMAVVYRMMDPTAQKLISEAEYQRVWESVECPGFWTGLGPRTIKLIRFESPTTAVARVEQAGVVETEQWGYFAGQWRWVPNRQQREVYASGADAMISKINSEISCS